MNSRRDQKEKMLAEAFHETWSAGPTRNFALAAAKHVRRRTRTRNSLAVLGATAGITAALVLALRPQPAANGHAARSGKSVSPQIAPAYEIISDQELLAELKDRPLLVMWKKDGTHEVVLLDE